MPRFFPEGWSNRGNPDTRHLRSPKPTAEEKLRYEVSKLHRPDLETAQQELVSQQQHVEIVLQTLLVHPGATIKDTLGRDWTASSEFKDAFRPQVSLRCSGAEIICEFLYGKLVSVQGRGRSFDWLSDEKFSLIALTGASTGSGQQRLIYGLHREFSGSLPASLAEAVTRRTEMRESKDARSLAIYRFIEICYASNRDLTLTDVFGNPVKFVIKENGGLLTLTITSALIQGTVKLDEKAKRLEYSIGSVNAGVPNEMLRRIGLSNNSEGALAYVHFLIFGLLPKSFAFPMGEAAVTHNESLISTIERASGGDKLKRAKYARALRQRDEAMTVELESQAEEPIDNSNPFAERVVKVFFENSNSSQLAIQVGLESAVVVQTLWTTGFNLELFQVDRNHVFLHLDHVLAEMTCKNRIKPIQSARNPSRSIKVEPLDISMQAAGMESVYAEFLDFAQKEAMLSALLKIEGSGSEALNVLYLRHHLLLAYTAAKEVMENVLLSETVLSKDQITAAQLFISPLGLERIIVRLIRAWSDPEKMEKHLKAVSQRLSQIHKQSYSLGPETGDEKITSDSDVHVLTAFLQAILRNEEMHHLRDRKGNVWGVNRNQHTADHYTITFSLPVVADEGKAPENRESISFEYYCGRLTLIESSTRSLPEFPSAVVRLESDDMADKAMAAHMLQTVRDYFVAPLVEEQLTETMLQLTQVEHTESRDAMLNDFRGTSGDRNQDIFINVQTGAHSIRMTIRKDQSFVLQLNHVGLPQKNAFGILFGHEYDSHKLDDNVAMRVLQYAHTLIFREIPESLDREVSGSGSGIIGWG